MENKNFMNKLKEFGGKYKGIIIGLVIVIFAIYTYVSFKPDGYEKLYSSLSDADKQAIVVELSKRGVDYQIDDATKTISVKKENVSWVRQEMSDMGLPSNQSGAQGYDIFMESSLGSTKKDLELRELKARKGQLELELVRSFPFIDEATVNLTIPEQTSLFEKEEKKGTASVTLGFKRGSDITKQQLLGIQNMVSSAIPGVAPEDVKVIDNKKGIISDSILEENNLGSSQYEKQMTIEKESENGIHDDIKRSLSSLFGYDNVQINVKVAINFDDILRKSENFDNKGVLRSRNKQAEDTAKIDGITNPEAGIDANGEVVGYDVNSKDGKVVYKQKKENTTENYEISKTIETVKKNPELTNTNIVVWVNQAALKQRQINLNQFRQAIGIAAGLKYNQPTDSFDNGQVSVLFLDFQPKDKVEIKKPVEKKGLGAFLDKYGLFAGIGLVVLLAVVGVVLFLLNKKKKQEEAEAIAAMERRREPEKLEQNGLEAETQSEGIHIVFDDDDAESEEQKQIRIKKEVRHKELNEQVIQLSDEYPTESAEYIKKLLKERK
ncbi:flagellar basal-body MS-ring/collar protein FliF [Bacillus thuringiensis]|uniref:flagellar basal-body MS-ring/collar protein FliF n=1 Tax=Bacillus thuringiensis TaxID=1428 RepID=UPI0021D69D65|nr:flagellar basal-body MS-ring/collar protein FliF [Bacillus thuringiensis]MCU7667009.1 flagellar basal-body MS-ring/collar protein FliF [Bacillus thuringiensis]